MCTAQTLSHRPTQTSESICLQLCAAYFLDEVDAGRAACCYLVEGRLRFNKERYVGNVNTDFIETCRRHCHHQQCQLSK